jgi:NADH:ubiquinone oxidoreductase subunit 4 (subunit M)
MLRAYRRTFLGSPVEGEIAAGDLKFSLRFAAAMLIAVSIFFGFFPQTLVQKISPAFGNYFAISK